MDYSFDVDHAKHYGVEEAILLHNFLFWIRHNRANRQNEHDGRTWTYNTLEAFAELFPFWSVRQIRRILDSLIEQGVIVKGNHNARAYDRTCWYALTDESLLELPTAICQNGQIEKPERSKGSDRTGEPIPDIKPDEKRRREAEFPAAPSSEPAPTLSPLLLRIKQEALARGAPLVFGRDFSSGIAELTTAGISEGDLLQAFAVCLETAPERMTFFPRDFLKWRKMSRAKTDRDQRTLGTPTNHQKREQAGRDRKRILEEQGSSEGRALIEAAIAQLPWRRVKA